MSHWKILGIVSLISALGLAAWLTWVHISYTNMPPVQKLQLLWHDDSKLLAQKNLLHEGFKSIGDIKVNSSDETTQKWAQELQIPFEKSPEGKHRLEILLISWTNNNKMGAIIQYDLFEIESGNLLWELGRTFTLNEDYSPEK